MTPSPTPTPPPALLAPLTPVQFYAAWTTYDTWCRTCLYQQLRYEEAPGAPAAKARFKERYAVDSALNAYINTATSVMYERHTESVLKHTVDAVADCLASLYLKPEAIVSLFVPPMVAYLNRGRPVSARRLEWMELIWTQAMQALLAHDIVTMCENMAQQDIKSLFTET